MNNINFSKTAELINGWWEQTIIPQLCDYIRIPNKSPMFDSQWQARGHMDRAVRLLRDWCQQQPIAGMTVEVIQDAGRTPVLLCEIPAYPSAGGSDRQDTVLLYGHLDKQPEFTGWSDGLSPWEPVIRDGKLYGRGGADDGYAVFASLAAIRALQEQGVAHERCVVLIEACEESGSVDLPHYVERLAGRLGTPSLVVCLDAGSGNYEQLWCTTSLRGGVVGTVTVEVLTEGVHSGLGTGIAPSAFRVLRALLNRLENEVTGDMLVEETYAPIPADRREQARAAGAVLGEETFRTLPFVRGVQPLSNSPEELILNNTWRPSLAVTGMDGLPAVKDGGNVLLPAVAAKLSVRLAPTADAAAAGAAIKKILEEDPPYGARVHFELQMSGAGCDLPPTAPWLAEAIQGASQAAFGREAIYLGTGGGIPFIGMLAKRFAQAQFLITGVLGPNSNAHGPNEFLHIDYARRLTVCVASVLADHRQRPAG
jgi:acetylornithine deacetylase/succinyl-diaminopimelate desuccinylase-like protein